MLEMRTRTPQIVGAVGQTEKEAGCLKIDNNGLARDCETEIKYLASS